MRKSPRRAAVVSGGQTGVDRAALDAALALKLLCGGWCPKGRVAEDGVIPDSYPLRETSSARYDLRTRKNVEDSDGTLILYRNSIHAESGTAYTAKIAKKLRKPLLMIDLDARPKPALLREWIVQHRIAILNVAGPRESRSPGIHDAAMKFLTKALG